MAAGVSVCPLVSVSTLKKELNQNLYFLGKNLIF